jgi:hypothetical protein
MKRYISFSATREVTEANQPVPLPLRRTQDVARQALVNLGGLTYPLLQRSSMWSNPEEVDGGVTFTFDRQKPYGDARFAQDLSFLATREPTDDEAEPPLIFLEALAYEFTFTMWFHHKVIAAFGRPGMFRIGLGFAGFADAQIDWAGFQEEPAVQREQGVLTNWRFAPPREVVAYESPGVSFPCTNKNDLVVPIAQAIAECSFAVKGYRRTAFDRTESRVVLSQTSIEGVVTSALNHIR